MKVYQVILSATNPEKHCAPYVQIDTSFHTLREAEEYFARTIESLEGSRDYECDLNDDTFVAKSKISGLVYYYEIHTAIIKEAH